MPEPSGFEQDEDITFLESDSLVNVAPSRISTYKSRKLLPNLGNWSERLDMLLLQAYDQFPSNWQKIARVLGDKKEPNECRERYEVLQHLKKQGHFTNEEDLMIEQAVAKYGKSWALIVKKCFKGRTAKQIRDRYMKTLLKRNQKSTYKHFQNHFTIKENEEEESDSTPRQIDRSGVRIDIAHFNQEQEKRLPEDTESMAVNSPPIYRDRHRRQKTDSSIFTDESVKDAMKGTDRSWYNRLPSKRDLAAKACLDKPSKRLDSKEQYKNLMSISSEHSSANAERLLAKATEVNNSSKAVPMAKLGDTSLFISKATFQDSWHN